MKHILLFLCALLFALTGNTAPACNEPEQLLAEARTATNAAGSVSSGEMERAMAEARRTMETTGRRSNAPWPKRAVRRSSPTVKSRAP